MMLRYHKFFSIETRLMYNVVTQLISLSPAECSDVYRIKICAK